MRGIRGDLGVENFGITELAIEFATGRNAVVDITLDGGVLGTDSIEAGDVVISDFLRRIQSSDCFF